MATISIEEKAKRYDEALERAKDFIKGEVHYVLRKGENIMCWVFPELKESEDERIRKVLVGWIKCEPLSSFEKGFSQEQILAWLEKQSIDISSFPEEQQVFMQKYTGLDKITLIKLLAERDANNAEIIESFEKQGKKKSIEPQQDMLSQEKYAKAIDECVYGEQKPAWSEEDETTRKTLINLVEMYYGGCVDKSEKNRLLDFLKSLRPQNTWKPSKEQIEALLKLEEMHVLEHEKNQENAHLYMVVKSIREQLLKLRKE